MRVGETWECIKEKKWPFSSGVEKCRLGDVAKIKEITHGSMNGKKRSYVKVEYESDGEWTVYIFELFLELHIKLYKNRGNR